MSGHNTLTQDDDIDVAGLFSAIWNKKILLITITLITFVVLLVVLSLISPRYESSARILIENGQTVFTQITDNNNNNRFTDNRFDQQAIGSQVEVINSDELALQVIRKLKLQKRSEFSKSGFTNTFQDMLAMVGLGSPSISSSKEEIALRAFRKKLDVYAVDRSRVIVVEFWSNDPKLAQEVPNVLAKTYLSLEKKTQKANTNDATEWLGPEIDGMRERLRSAEAKVAEFRANSDILVGDNNALLATQQLSEVSTELSRVKAERSSAEAKVASIRAALESGSSIDVVPEVIASPLIQRLRERQVGLRAQISDLSTSLLPNHPSLKALNSQVSDFDNQIRQAAGNILASLENNVDLARKTETDLVKEVNRLKIEAARVGEAEVELRALEREAAAERELLQTYLRRFREAASRQNENFFPVDARIISKASLPVEAYFPRVIPFSIAGAVAVMILTMVGILAASLLSGAAMVQSGRVRDPYIPEAVAIPPVRASEPTGPTVAAKNNTAKQRKQPGKKEMVFLDQPNARVENNNSSEQIRLPEVSDAPQMSTASFSARPASSKPEQAHINTLAVRFAASVIAEMQEGRIVVASPAGEAGSKTCWMLARAISRIGKQIAVVDMSGGGLTSREMLGSKDLPGIFNLMAGHSTFDTITYRDRVSSTHIIPAGTIAPGQPTPDIGSLAEVINAIAQSYDFVVIDCGDTDAGGISTVADTNAIVVISAIGAAGKACDMLEKNLGSDGYTDILQIIPDAIDEDKEALVAA